MSTLALAEQQSDILASLRRLKGRGTVGDVVADAGLPADDVRAGLKALLESHHGHLAVADSGELLYEFDEKLIARGTEPALARLKKTVTSVATKTFKAAIVVMLVVYFVVFVALVIAALFANKDGDSKGGWGRRGGHRGHFHFSDFWLWYWLMGSDWRYGRPYYGHRWERSLPKRTKVPFYKKVFAFVFGPDRPVPTQQQLDRSKLRLIRARNGVLTTAELVEHTGLEVPAAEDDMGRLLGAYDGEAVVSPDGELVYAFPSVMTSAHDERSTEPNPAWLRLEPQRELTGNTAGSNAIVAGMNAFTLLAAATSPWFIFPRLGIGGAAAYVALVLVPVIFSFLFFAVPGLRMWGVTRENKRRKRRNVRKVLLGLVYERALDGGTVRSDEVAAFVAGRLQGAGHGAIDKELRTLAAEFDADVHVDDAGVTHYAFRAVREQFAASETVRRKLQLENRSLGEIVYSTGDTDAEAGERELKLFDRKLSGEEASFEKYLPATDRVGYEDDFDLVSFDEELRQQGILPA